MTAEKHGNAKDRRNTAVFFQSFKANDLVIETGTNGLDEISQGQTELNDMNGDLPESSFGQSRFFP